MKHLKKIEFFASMYLEAVCDETRVAFLEHWREEQSGLADKVGTFRKRIETEDYSSLLNSFRELMGGKKAVMFQTKAQNDLTGKPEQSITVLTSSQDEEQEQIDILRSELLEFYCNHDSHMDRPFSQMLLDVKDTARVVLVGREQKDLAVQNYVRQPCTIAYARLDYTDRLCSDVFSSPFFTRRSRAGI